LSLTYHVVPRPPQHTHTHTRFLPQLTVQTQFYGTDDEQGVLHLNELVIVSSPLLANARVNKSTGCKEVHLSCTCECVCKQQTGSGPGRGELQGGVDCDTALS